MWSKLLNWIAVGNSKQPTQQTPPSPTVLVGLALAEIDKNIASNQQALRETKNTQTQIQDKLKTQISLLNEVGSQAEKAVKKNDELTARSLLGQKNWLQEQAQQYQHLLAQLAQTIQQLEKQVSGLEMRRIEITTKETLLTAQLQKVTSQKEMQNYLGELDKMLGFDSYEKQIEAITIENQLANDILAFDEALEQSAPTQTIDQMQQKMAHEEREAQEKKMNGIFTRYFDANKSLEQESKKKQDFNVMRQDLLGSFFAKKNEPIIAKEPEKDKIVSDFFAVEPKTADKSEKQKQIDSFFRKE